MPPLNGVAVVVGTTMLPFGIDAAEVNGAAVVVGTAMLLFAIAIARPG